MADSNTLAPPKPVPTLNIPPSDTACKVSIIDSTAFIKGIPLGLLTTPMIKGADFLDCPSFAFLVEHPSGRKVLFDLGVRKDWEHLAPGIVQFLKTNGWGIDVKKNVAEILEENGVKLDSIEAIVWRYESSAQSILSTPRR